MMRKAVVVALALALAAILGFPAAKRWWRGPAEDATPPVEVTEVQEPGGTGTPEPQPLPVDPAFLDDSGKAVPLGLVFKNENGLYEGVFRWATLVDEDGFYLRFPESSMSLGLGREAPDAFWVYCLGRYKNDGMSVSRAESATECESLNADERAAAYERFRIRKDPGLAVPTVGSVRYDGHNGEYYTLAKFSNGRGILVETENPAVFLADVTMLTQDVQNDDLHARTDGFLFVLVRADDATSASRPLLNRGTKDAGCYQAFDQIDAFYSELTGPRYSVKTMRELHETGPVPGKVNVVLRHDLDIAAYGARQMAALERSYGLKSTYHVNFASGFSGLIAPRGRYVLNPSLEQNLRAIQSLGHDIGFHNDLMFFNLFFDIEAKAWVHQYLDPLRAAGLPFISNTHNGSPFYGETGIDNLFTFSEYRMGGEYWWDGYKDHNGADGSATFVRDGAQREVVLAKLSIADIGIAYDSATLFRDFGKLGFTMASFSDGGVAREEFVAKLRSMTPNTVVEVLTHPVDWSLCNFDGDIILDMKLRDRRSETYGRVRWPTLGEVQ